jgi:hypothetical protein
LVHTNRVQRALCWYFLKSVFFMSITFIIPPATEYYALDSRICISRHKSLSGKRQSALRSFPSQQTLMLAANIQKEFFMVAAVLYEKLFVIFTLIRIMQRGLPYNIAIELMLMLVL